jgi:hypothetical protein
MIEMPQLTAELSFKTDGLKRPRAGWKARHFEGPACLRLNFEAYFCPKKIEACIWGAETSWN